MELANTVLIIFHKLRACMEANTILLDHLLPQASYEHAWKPRPFYWIIFHKLRAWKPTPFYCEEGSIKWSIKYQKRSSAGLWPAIFKSGHMAFVSGRTHTLLQGHVEGSAEPHSNLYVGIYSASVLI
ncbi:hypothetical protein NC651_039069 [Populus alba x Populus x berolinensis]|nr:hypothetical protein NC651_039069 [Populus alba x Populus x berolinensis]